MKLLHLSQTFTVRKSSSTSFRPTFLLGLVILVAFSCDFDYESTPPEFIDLQGEATFPEGIITRANGDIFVTGFGDGSIQRIVNGNEVSYFSAPGENLTIGVGLAIDESRDRLWVSNFNFDLGGGVPGSQLKVFDLNSGEVIASLPEEFIPGVFFNEVAIDDNGRVYISDTFNPQIWTAGEDLSDPTVLVNNELLSNPAPDQPFDLNGLAISNDGEVLVASVMDRLDAGGGRLVRIDLETHEVSAVTLSGEDAVAAFAGSDGMFFLKDQLFMVNVFSEAGAIITADFNSAYTEAELTIRDAFQEVYNRPTASAIREGRLWTVNSQLDHIIDDNNGALGTPVDAPFQVVNVDLYELFKD
ncbi:MAG TPA: hypothetical protein DCR93_26100 [Cytophagales bacterium]|nr:hypothetical protein [Cytophagales bacterium]HAP62820.1 hypothetical protein [Cytophagales bacterium]